MKEAGSIVASALLVAALIGAHAPASARAQVSSPSTCSSTVNLAPMQGHYSGPWHSDGDYNFAVFNTNLRLHIIINGTITADVDATGQVTGTVTGTVTAPVNDYGRRDISSGEGTITGAVSGVFTGSGSLLVLTHPNIDMHWGTFGGHAVERNITMPDYTFSVGGSGCVTANGAISETDFPVQNVVMDAVHGDIAQAPGIGSATGAWQISSDKAALFHDLSTQLDTFENTADSLLANVDAVSPQQLDAQLLQPFQTLRAGLSADPQVARCLLRRLQAWEERALSPLLAHIQQSTGSADLVSLRHLESELSVAQSLNTDCTVPMAVVRGSITGRIHDLLAVDLQVGNWPGVALDLREGLMLSGSDSGAAWQLQVAAALHVQRTQSMDAVSRLALSRLAYTFGDDQDVQIEPAVAPPSTKSTPKSSKKRKRHKAKSKPTSNPTPAPQTIDQFLETDIAPIHGTATASPAPTFSWSSVPGATHYVVVVAGTMDRSPLWSWSGAGTTAMYGDTSLSDSIDSGSPPWPIALPNAYTWVVLALDGQNHVVGLKLR